MNITTATMYRRTARVCAGGVACVRENRHYTLTHTRAQ
jgi:hypothetical protein